MTFLLSVLIPTYNYKKGIKKILNGFSICNRSLLENIEIIIGDDSEKALFSKDKGLSDLKLILSKGKNFLNENGKVYLEHAPNQYEELNKFALKNGYLNFSNLNDLNGDKRVSVYQC